MAVYRKLLDAEQARRDLFARGVAPGFFGEPPEHLRLRLEAVNRLREGRPAEAAEVLARANEAIPAVRGPAQRRGLRVASATPTTCSPGCWKSWPTAGISGSAWSRCGCVTMNPPRFPRDLLFIPAHLELEDEQGEVFLPALYPGSHEHADDSVRLGRGTDWKELDGGADPGSRPAYLPAR